MDKFDDIPHAQQFLTISRILRWMKAVYIPEHYRITVVLMVQGLEMDCRGGTID
jgi:hypothetical protein